MKSYLVYFTDDSQVTINGTSLKADGSVITIINDSETVAIFPLAGVQGVADITALEDEDEDYSEDEDEEETK